MSWRLGPRHSFVDSALVGDWSVGVVGYPISHSLSPTLHQRGLDLAGLRGTSTAVPLTIEEFQNFDSLATTFDALSVTMPLKALFARHCASLSPRAQRLGVVNTIRFGAGGVEGDNVDGEGFVASLRGELGVDVHGTHVLIEGSGGSATAIIDALVEHGAASVNIRSRNVATAEALAARYDVVRVNDGVADAIDLVVTTIPVSSRPDHVDNTGLSTHTVCVDITYDPRMSSWREHHENAGRRTLNGLAMLAYQAALQMQWWWDVEIDPRALLESIV